MRPIDLSRTLYSLRVRFTCRPTMRIYGSIDDVDDLFQGQSLLHQQGGKLCPVAPSPGMGVEV